MCMCDYLDFTQSPVHMLDLELHHHLPQQCTHIACGTVTAAGAVVAAASIDVPAALC